MSHTFAATNGTRFHFNSDSGGVNVIKPCTSDDAGWGVFIPANDILEFVAEWVRDERIAEIEADDTWTGAREFYNIDGRVSNLKTMTWWEVLGVEQP